MKKKDIDELVKIWETETRETKPAHTSTDYQAGEPWTGERILAFRKKYYLTHKAVSKKLPCSMQSLWNWETGERSPNPTYRRLFDELEQAYLKGQTIEQVREQKWNSRRKKEPR